MPPKRKSKRIIKRLDTDFSAEGLSFRGISSDLSGSGIFVRTSKPFSAGTLVDLAIHLPGNMVARLRGIVRWSIKIGQMATKNGMGIEIIESDQNYINYLNTLLPPEEQLQHKTGKKAESVSESAKSKPDARPKSEQTMEDDHIDSMISALFTKRGKK